MRALGGIVFTGLVVAAAACASSNEASGDHACTPGAYVYCRCEDRTEGTKLCHPDGKSFDACKCDGPPSGGDNNLTGGNEVGGTPEQVDAGGPVAGPHIDPKCVGKLGLVAGSDKNNDVYLVGYAGDGNFTASKSSAPVRGPITILPAGGALVATYRSQYAILSTKYANNSWVPVSSIGTDVTISSPTATSMTAYGGDLKMVYLSSDDSKYHVATYKSSGWDDGQALAESSTATQPTLPGKSAPAIASPTGSLIVVVSTDDGALARETYSNYNWTSFIKVPEAAYPSPPGLAALDSASGKDLLLVWAGNDVKLHASTRDASSKTWSNGFLVDNSASATDLSLTAMPNGGAMLVFMGSDDKAYFSTYSPASGFAAPKEMVAGANPELASMPSVTLGRCGSDISIAYAQKSDGAVKLLRYSGTTMTGPFAVGGVTSATWVGVGEMP